MHLNSSLYGACPAPFYDLSLFPTQGGYLDGRLCSQEGDATCCLPCPATYWTYADSFKTYNIIAAWLNVAGFALLLFLLLSYAFLPKQKTRSHYLSVSLIIAVVFLNLGFIIPLGAKPHQCFNEVTPNDMYSSLTCAFSGAFIIAGGLSGATWIFVRALSMHIQICWNIVPGRKFFYCSQVLGWAVPATLFAVTMAFSGVSFRFGGSACHVNHLHSIQTFWGWLIAIAALAVVMQMCTFGYCAHVFISNLRYGGSHDRSATTDSLPEYYTSIRTIAAEVIWSRLKSIIFLQWRGILIVSITLVDVIVFAVVFLQLDDLESSLIDDVTRVEAWLVCLVENAGDRDACLTASTTWMLRESVVTAVLVMISLIGLEVFFLLFRFSLFTGWRDLFVSLYKEKDDDFIGKGQRGIGSASATKQHYGADGIAFEMQKPTTMSTTDDSHDTSHDNRAYTDDDKMLSPTIPSIATSPTLCSPPPHYTSPNPFSGDFIAKHHHNPSQTKSPNFSHQHPQAICTIVRATSDSSTTSPHRRGRCSLHSQNRTESNGTLRSMGWDPTSSFAASFNPTRKLSPVRCATTKTTENERNDSGRGSSRGWGDRGSSERWPGYGAERRRIESEGYDLHVPQHEQLRQSAGAAASFEPPSCACESQSRDAHHDSYISTRSAATSDFVPGQAI